MNAKHRGLTPAGEGVLTFQDAIWQYLRKLQKFLLRMGPQRLLALWPFLLRGSSGT